MFKPLLIGAGLALALAAPAIACTDITSKTIKLTGCVDEQWQSQEVAAGGAVEFYYLTADQNYALQVITEAESFGAQQLHDAILNNALTAAKGDKTKVKEISARTEEIAGKPFSLLEYTVDLGTVVIDNQNFYYSEPGLGTVQLLISSTPEGAAAAGYKAGEFASTVKIGG